MPPPPAMTGLSASTPVIMRTFEFRPGGWASRPVVASRGTDASTAALLAAAPAARIVAVDASAGMLAMAAGKRWPDSVRFVHSRVVDLADAGFVGPSTASWPPI